MEEFYAHEELKKKVRTGWQLYPDTPGLMEAAREVIQPLIEGMRGQKIIYHCRISCLMRVDDLEMDDKGFKALGVPLREYPHPDPYMDGMRPKFRQPLKFYGPWSIYHISGKKIKPAMIADFFIPDQGLVNSVEAAAQRGATPKEIYDLIFGNVSVG